MMGELVKFVPPPPPMTFGELERVAQAIAKSNMFGCKDPNAVLTLCLLAQAEGQHPAVVFRDYSIIQGKPSKTAEAMLRDFIGAGGKVTWHKLDEECASATFSHPSGGEVEITWTMAHAHKAGLGGREMWKKYPRQMLRSRVISEGVRTICPTATSGLYVPEEVRDFDDHPSTEVISHDAATGEILDDDPALREPAAREKLEGPHTSKTALRKAVNDVIALVRTAPTIDDLDALRQEHKKTINQARRDWPMLVEGDPRIGEDLGLKGEFEKRRQELDTSLTFQLLMSTLDECTSWQELTAWLSRNADKIEELDGDESRRFEEHYEEREAALKLVAQASV